MLTRDEEIPTLKYNDIDIYYGSFGDGNFKRTGCKQTSIDNVLAEVNLISCINLNTSCLVANFDINAVAVCVHVQVRNEKVSSAEWVVKPEFQHFVFKDNTLRSWQTDSPSRTLVRLAWKSYQMGLEFSMSCLSLEDGELFTSHRKKVEEMEKQWGAYPFSGYKLTRKSKSSFVFTPARAECTCGKQANLKCKFRKCSKCCKLGKVQCKVTNHVYMNIVLTR